MEQDAEEKTYLETRGGELPSKEPELPLEQQAESEATEVAVQAETEEEIPELKKSGVAVPYNRFKEERDKRKAEKQRADELALKVARFEGELAALKHPKPPETAAPKIEEQPVEWNQDPEKAHNFLAKKVEKVLQIGEEQQKRQQYDQARQQFETDYKAKVLAYTKDAPDFPDAYNFLAESRISEYEALGMSRDQAQQATWRDEANIALASMQNGKNPADAMYAIAKTRGYKPKAAEKGSGEETLKTVERGQKVSTSLGGSSGGGNSGPATLESLADMDADEFRAIMTDENKRAKFWKRYGG